MAESRFSLIHSPDGESGGFRYTAEELADLFDPKKPEVFKEMGSLDGIVKALKTNPKKGLSKSEMVNNFAERRATYGVNVIPPAKTKAFFMLVWETLHDKMLILLIVAAIISIVLGSISERSPKGAIEGFAILIAVMIVVFVTSGNDFQKEKQFRKLNAKKEDKPVNVIRDGEVITISVFDVNVGDIVAIATGDVLCADGVFVEGHNMKADESSATGETDAIKKGLGEKLDPFLLSGSQITEGVGKMLVLAVGPHSYYGHVLMSLNEDEPEDTPLQAKLGRLADLIGKAGMIIAGSLFVILVIKYFIIKAVRDEISTLVALDVLKSIINYVITSVTIVVVAVPEGLPLAVTISLAYSMLKMLKDQNLVRHLDACETMGGATNICTDKTGTLTQNRMTVVTGAIAGRLFSDNDSAHDIKWNKDVLQVLIDGICVNATCEKTKNVKGEMEFMGSKTECALSEFAEKFGVEYQEVREANPTVFLYPFSSARKRMSTLVRGPRGFRLYTKGASEIILGLCTGYINGDGEVERLDEGTRKEVEQKIVEFSTDALRVLCLAYVDVEEELEDWEDLREQNLILIGIVGIRDPLRPEVTDAVRTCQDAGITVRMVTGDNIITAENIAKKCGIFTEGGLSMEGPKFRKLSRNEMDKIMPRLQVLARSSPDDKKRLVRRLKELQEVVAVTGDGTNDGPALRLAHVGFAMGIAGTDVAKEASDIIIMDDNFASIVKAVMWGRNVFNSICKFIQFQLTVNIVAVLVAFIGAISSDKGESPLNPVQLLWVNLIMDTFAALALATDPPTEDLLKRKPNSKNAPLISRTMWRNILGQGVYQLIISLLVLYSPASFGLVPLGPTEADLRYYEIYHNSVIFNNFVIMQLFNEFNARKIYDNEKNIFQGIHRNYIFLSVIIGSVAMQVIMVELGGEFVGTTPISGKDWGIAFLCGAISLPLGFALKFIPIKEKAIPIFSADDDGEESGDQKPSKWTLVRQMTRQLAVVNYMKEQARLKAERDASLIGKVRRIHR